MVSIKKGIEIRKATSKDANAIVVLWRALINHHITRLGAGRGIYAYKKNKEQLYTKFLKKQLKSRKAAVFIAEKRGRPVGHIMVEIKEVPAIYLHDREAYVDELIVGERYRRKGVGTLLLSEAENWARSKDMYALSLSVHRRNKRALSAYKKYGFRTYLKKMAKILG